ncbi:MAG: hypothetical protein M1820_009034 [Bogoriella megaspora]|nr:MAG: hypothetical protein M1820_009034 [Bogoriella megaspora]
MYRYSPLDTTRHEIRLLTLEPGSFFDDIVTGIQHVPLDYKLEYEALSYTWGPSVPEKTINVSGDDFKVRENLDTALRYLRLTDQPRTLWIDAICINQKDLNERNQQVIRMREIYSLANEVIVWLGTETPDSRITIDFIQRYNELASGDDRDDEIKETLAKEENDHILNAISSFLRQEYWSRVWIIQEIRVANRLRIYSGNDTIQWTAFETVIGIVGALLEELMASDGKGLAFGTSRTVSLKELNPLQICLLRVEYLNISTDAATFSFWKGRGASDPRDCLYALYGLFESEDNDKKLTRNIDYNLTMKEVFINFVIYGMTNPATPSEGRLNFICLREPYRTKTELPSWIPDFSIRVTSFTELITCRTQSILRGYRPTEALDLQSSIDGDILRSRGFILDTIDRRGGHFDDSSAAKKGPRGQVPPSVLSVAHHWKVFQSWTDMALSSSSTSRRENASARNRLISFWRSIYTDADDAWNFYTDIEPELYEKAFGIAVDHAANQYPFDSLQDVVRSDLGDKGNTFHISMEFWAMLSRHRRLAVTAQEIFVLAPADVKDLDLVCVLLDCDLPVILRKVEDHYMFVGDCYVENHMHGEITEALKRGEHKLMEFEII